MIRVFAFDILGPITTLVNNFICWVETGIVAVLNFAIAAIGVMLGVVIGLLPSMPTLPTPPTDFLAGIRFLGVFFDLQFMWTTITTVAVLYGAWLVIQIPLKWGKAEPE